LPQHSYVYFTAKTNVSDPDAVIWYRNDLYTLLDSGTFWLSPTPDKPFSEGFSPFHQVVPRLWIWAQFTTISNGLEFVFTTTHFDNNYPCQIKSAPLVLNRTSPLATKLPVISTGDFNSPVPSEAYEVLTFGINSEGYHFNDSFYMAKQWRHDTNVHVNLTYDPVNAIDHMFVSGQAKFTVYDWIVNTYEFTYKNISQQPSDHPAYAAVLSFTTD